MNKEFVVERDGRTFVLYAGLLDLAHERGLRGITTTLVQVPSDMNGQLAICHATVETEQGTFTGLGDACPSNVTRMMAPHLIRMAETRAKARALRDAVNVGVTALEELGEEPEPHKVAMQRSSAASTARPPDEGEEPAQGDRRPAGRASGNQPRRGLHPLDGGEELEDEAGEPARGQRPGREPPAGARRHWCRAGR